MPPRARADTRRSAPRSTDRGQSAGVEPRAFTLLESGHHVAGWELVRTIMGMALHLTLLGSAVFVSSLEYRRTRSVEPDLPRAVYLAPARQPVSWPVEERLHDVSLQAGDGAQGDAESGVGAPVGADGIAAEVDPPAPPAEAFVLTEIEVDSAVVPDPASGGPIYPPALLELHIEGAVLARFVVDSTGLADPTTFMALTTTHDGFAEAVRDALPRMRFRPARLAGQPVPQLVVQHFAFRIAPPTAAPAPPPIPDSLTGH